MWILDGLNVQKHDMSVLNEFDITSPRKLETAKSSILWRPKGTEEAWFITVNICLNEKSLKFVLEKLDQIWKNIWVPKLIWNLKRFMIRMDTVFLWAVLVSLRKQYVQRCTSRTSVTNPAIDPPHSGQNYIKIFTV